MLSQVRSLGAGILKAQFTRPLFTSSAFLQGNVTATDCGASSEPGYTYLPPGCSMREPTYISLSDPVYLYDQPVRNADQPMESFTPSFHVSKRTTAMHTVGTPQQDGNYMYLPPGCSMQDPVYISLSDPVYVTDVKPSK